MLFKKNQNQALSGSNERVVSPQARKRLITSKGAAIVAALLISLFMIWVTYPSSFLNGQGEYFEGGDAAQHVTGWLFYAHDGWHFPLLHTVLLNFPHGTSIAFTDSIPLAALLFKPFAAWLPEQFHYIGWWHAVAYLVQGLGAVALIRALGVRHLPGAIAAVAMSTMWPTLYWRMGHTSLMTHGLILFALALYFSGRKAGDNTARIGLLYIALSVTALLIHPYLFAMCYTIFIAYLVDQGLSGKGWKKQGGLFVLSLAMIALVGGVLGYFSHGNTVTSGFGEYALNLAAPFCGGTLIECPIRGPLIFGESFTYFGAGALTIILVGIAVRLSTSISLLRRYPALIVLMLLFLLYAISPTVRWGSYVAVPQLYKIPASLETLTGTFRAGARFFWPVAYLIFFGALAAVLRASSFLAAAVLIVALPLQWIDTSYLRFTVRSLASGPALDNLANWDAVLKDVSAIRLYPAYTCGDVSDKEYVQAQRIAAYYKKTLDTGHIARLKVDCEANDSEFKGPFTAGELYMLPLKQLRTVQLKLPVGFHEAARRGECAETKQFILCKPGTDAAYWADKKIEARPISALEANSVQWDAAQLPSKIGRVSGTQRQADASDGAGFLTFGPYAKAAPGTYRFKLVYDSAQSSETRVGRWDVAIMDDKATLTPLSQGDLYGSAGVKKEISGEFVIEANAARKVEVRTYFNGAHDLRVHQLTITRQGLDASSAQIKE